MWWWYGDKARTLASEFSQLSSPTVLTQSSIGRIAGLAGAQGAGEMCHLDASLTREDSQGPGCKWGPQIAQQEALGVCAAGRMHCHCLAWPTMWPGKPGIGSSWPVSPAAWANDRGSLPVSVPIHMGQEHECWALQQGQQQVGRSSHQEKWANANQPSRPTQPGPSWEP